MFKKLLIANRGEIACRIIRTARRLGIATVAIYSEADEGALHAEMADESLPIGPAPAAQSYLAVERIVEAALRSGAQAVHPGFGFLSERAAFAEALEKAGIVFVGPPVAAIAAMGDKIESKKLATQAGVSIVPGHLEAVGDVAIAGAVAREIGYPVMIKAAAGGGGKGMRVAYGETELEEGFIRATSEATASFGDGRVFIEKFIEEPRHIEIQVLADGHGNCLYLGERECSIQRRHQKVIEEAPSPFLDAATRQAMGEQAVALARAVGYRSAGTVEFIVDRNRNFYFLEMNTRLQVEHPVTEMITGIDLVEEMLRVAAGERLRLAQHQVRLDGWAMEARIYAEDPERGFLPSSGRLVRLVPPAEGNGVRVDTGVVEGSEISVYYDPMIAKLVTHGGDRAQAIERMQAALDAYCIRGIAHNVGFLASIFAHPRFAAGRLSTAFIAEEYPDGFKGAPLNEPVRHALLGCAVFAQRALDRRDAGIAGQLNGWAPPSQQALVVRLGEGEHHVQVAQVEGGLDLTLAAGQVIPVRSHWRPGKLLWRGSIEDRQVAVQIDRLPGGLRLTHAGVSLKVTVANPQAAALAALMPVKALPDTSRYLLSPMPGLVLQVHAAAGEEVKGGQPLVVVEAMKMENVLRAERDGRIKTIAVKVGDSLATDQVILEFE
ncbi:MAG: acetyl/propionyl/methylcrotonyl-CoA carboxylase subunit alpha [Alphaproteobacteria bacterium]|nr:acetyl/propionyl/methylcrotonyl-CoA carboxylase subunit alpha [Alphaproteobacteria bacterium]